MVSEIIFRSKIFKVGESQELAFRAVANKIGSLQTKKKTKKTEETLALSVQTSLAIFFKINLILNTGPKMFPLCLP